MKRGGKLQIEIGDTQTYYKLTLSIPKLGVFRPYIALFNPIMDTTSSQAVSQFKICDVRENSVPPIAFIWLNFVISVTLRTENVRSVGSHFPLFTLRRYCDTACLLVVLIKGVFPVVL